MKDIAVLFNMRLVEGSKNLDALQHWLPDSLREREQRLTPLPRESKRPGLVHQAQLD